MGIYHCDKYLDYVCYNVSDHTDGTVIQHTTNNVDACTHGAYLFFRDVVGVGGECFAQLLKIEPWNMSMKL